MVSHYDHLWAELVDVEDRLKSPDVLSNRGGILLKLQNEQKRITKELPKRAAEIESEISKFDRVGTGTDSETTMITDSSSPRQTHTQPFSIYGMSFPEYVQTLKGEMQEKKELERRRRKESRERAPSAASVSSARGPGSTNSSMASLPRGHSPTRQTNATFRK